MGATTAKGLQRKLVNNDLSPEDKENLGIVRKVRRLRKEGATILECARHVGITERRLQQWMTRDTYKVLDTYLATLEGDPLPDQVDAIVRTAREQFAQFAPDAIDFYREAFSRNPVEDQTEKGIFKDRAMAQWATEKVSRGLGLDQPEHAKRPVVNIQNAYIHAETQMVTQDDAEADAASKAIDVTPSST